MKNGTSYLTKNIPHPAYYMINTSEELCKRENISGLLTTEVLSVLIL